MRSHCHVLQLNRLRLSIDHGPCQRLSAEKYDRPAPAPTALHAALDLAAPIEELHAAQPRELRPGGVVRPDHEPHLARAIQAPPA